MPVDLRTTYRKLFAAFGPQQWWPGESPFEVMVGAILTQNTNWANVERAIANLKKRRVLSAQRLFALPVKRLAALIVPAGYYNIKAKRLRSFLDFFLKRYGADIRAMRKRPIMALRQELLEVNGIGPETADSILLYALDKPIFVVDAYTKRIFSRHGLFKEDAAYDEVQAVFMNDIRPEVRFYNEYHALIVRTGKEFCLKSKPRQEVRCAKENRESEERCVVYSLRYSFFAIIFGICCPVMVRKCLDRKSFLRGCNLILFSNAL